MNKYRGFLLGAFGLVTFNSCHTPSGMMADVGGGMKAFGKGIEKIADPRHDAVPGKGSYGPATSNVASVTPAPVIKAP